MTEASSRPTSPKQITPNEFSTKRGFAGIRKSAAVTVVPNRIQMTSPSPISVAAAMPVPIAAQIVDPLPYAQAHDVEHHQNDQKQQRRDQRKRLVVRQCLMVRAENKHRHADEVQHHRRHVQHVVRPVAPAGQKSVEVAEDFLGPQIDAAFSGIAMGQFDDGDALRPEEQEQRNDPQPDRDAAVGRNRRNHVQIEDGHHEQQEPDRRGRERA